MLRNYTRFCISLIQTYCVVDMEHDPDVVVSVFDWNQAVGVNIWKHFEFG